MATKTELVNVHAKYLPGEKPRLWQGGGWRMIRRVVSHVQRLADYEDVETGVITLSHKQFRVYRQISIHDGHAFGWEMNAEAVFRYAHPKRVTVDKQQKGDESYAER